MAKPTWYSQLQWHGPHSVADLNADRTQIPAYSGCYAFTTHSGPLRAKQVLYIGEAKVSLRRRLSAYLIDFRRPDAIVPKKRHKGGAFVLEARHENGDKGVFVHWVDYFGSPWQISLLESSLIDYLQPTCNDREESFRSGLLGAWESLDPDAL